MVSFFQKKEGNPESLYQLCFGLGFSSRGPLCTPYLILYRLGLAHCSLFCRCTERHHRHPRSHSKSVLTPEAGASCLSPHLLDSALGGSGRLTLSHWALGIVP